MILRKNYLEHLRIRLLLGVLILGTLWISYYLDYGNHKKLNELFNNEVQVLRSSIESRFDAHYEIILGVKGLVIALESKSLTPEMWGRYVNTLFSERLYEEIKGVGYVSFLPNDNNSKQASVIFSSRVLGDDIAADRLAPARNNIRRIFEASSKVIEFNSRFAALVRELGLPPGYYEGEDFLLFSPVFIVDKQSGNRVLVGGGLVVVSPTLLFDTIDNGSEKIKFTVDFLSDERSTSVYSGGAYGDRPIYFKPPTDGFDINYLHSVLKVDVEGMAAVGDGVNWFSPVFSVLLGAMISVFSFYIIWVSVKEKERAENLYNDNKHLLSRSEGRLKLILDNAGNGVIGVDQYGNINFSNKSGYSILGCDREDIYGKSIYTFIDGGRRDYEDEIFDSYKKSIPHYKFHRKFLTKSGGFVDVEATSTPILDSENKHFGGAVVILHDITDIKKFERDIVSANQELEEFTYRFSHDLRAPLASSIGLMELSKRYIKKQNTEKVLECTDMTLFTLRSMDCLAKNILILARLKRDDEDCDVVDVESLVSDILGELSSLEGARRLRVDIDFDVTRKFFIKKYRLYLIIKNLINNAIDYQNFEALDSFLLIRCREVDNLVVMTFEDNGLGIPVEQESKLFQMFKRFHPRLSSGSGLGLYIVKKCAESIGGDISYQNKSGHTVFSLTFLQSNEKNCNI